MTQPRDELAVFLGQMAFMLPNFNDTFAYACADTEQISVGDGEVLADFWRRHGWHGLVAVAAYARGLEPLPKIADDPRYQAALAELFADQPLLDPEDPEGKYRWTLRDEFELHQQRDELRPHPYRKFTQEQEDSS